jgi:hypothetical protein
MRSINFIRAVLKDHCVFAVNFPDHPVATILSNSNPRRARLQVTSVTSRPCRRIPGSGVRVSRSRSRGAAPFRQRDEISNTSPKRQRVYFDAGRCRHSPEPRAQPYPP